MKRVVFISVCVALLWATPAAFVWPQACPGVFAIVFAITLFVASGPVLAERR